MERTSFANDAAARAGDQTDSTVARMPTPAAVVVVSRLIRTPTGVTMSPFRWKSTNSIVGSPVPDVLPRPPWETNPRVGCASYQRATAVAWSPRRSTTGTGHV